MSLLARLRARLPKDSSLEVAADEQFWWNRIAFDVRMQTLAHAAITGSAGIVVGLLVLAGAHALLHQPAGFLRPGLVVAWPGAIAATWVTIFSRKKQELLREKRLLDAMKLSDADDANAGR